MFILYIRRKGSSSFWSFVVPLSFACQLAEDTLFHGIVAGLLPSQVAHRYRVTGVPAAGAAASARLLRGFVVTVWAAGPPHTRRYPLQAAHHLAQGHIRKLIAQGQLEAGSSVSWGVVESDAALPGPSAGSGRVLTEPTVALPVALPPPQGAGRPRFQVTLSPRALAQARADVLVDPTMERGGFLLGRLWRRPDDHVELLLEEALPAEATENSLASLGFTPQTWQRLAAHRQARGEAGPALLGFYHSHPPFGEEEPSPEEFPESRLFLSQRDWEVMATSFPAPYQVALVLAPAPGRSDPPGALFGWQGARLAALGPPFRKESYACLLP